jgi:uroporphyrinogen-III synthase
LGVLALLAFAILVPFPGALGAKVIAAIATVTADTVHSLNFPVVVHHLAATVAGYSH